MGLIPEEIEAHYLHGAESVRLSNEWGELEQLRTQQIVARHLPPPPAVILDVGGAAGAYAFPLALQGYEVHLIPCMSIPRPAPSAPPIRACVSARPRPGCGESRRSWGSIPNRPCRASLGARHYATSSGVVLASIVQGDARHLDFAATSADAVLLLGPLYHLVQRPERLKALLEARRLLRPEGVLFAASISRFASLIDGLSRGFFQDAEFRKIVEADLTDGLHRNPTDKLAYFTTAYFHRPCELAAEVREAGFRAIQTLAIEGPAWSTALFRQAWNDTEQRQKLLEFLSLIESEPSIQGVSAHIMAVASQPN